VLRVFHSRRRSSKASGRWVYPMCGIPTPTVPSRREEAQAEHLFQKGGFFVGSQADVVVPGVTPSWVEVAFIGRSNAGKSTLVNALLGAQASPTSKRPGLTADINFYQLGSPARPQPHVLVDLPGYGFAKKRNKATKAAWLQMITGYLHGRPATILRRVMLLLDIRRGVSQLDEEIMELMDAYGISYAVVLTKADTMARSRDREAIAAAVQAELQDNPAIFPNMNVVSARTGAGMRELRNTLALAVNISQLK
jgi:GTP-binding protein